MHLLHPILIGNSKGLAQTSGISESTLITLFVDQTMVSFGEQRATAMAHEESVFTGKSIQRIAFTRT
jgi:hypothetical protein